MKKQDNSQKEKQDKNEIILNDCARIIAQLTEDGKIWETPVPNLTFYRYDRPTKLSSALYEPCICLLTQGAKQVHLGKETFVYDTRNYLITSVHLPTMVRVIEASPEKPALGIVFQLDQREMSQLMVDSNLPSPRIQKSRCGMSTGAVTYQLLSAFKRLIDLLEEPDDIPILAPIISREIVYRLLVGDQGDRLRQIASTGSRSQQISRAINWVKQNFSHQLRVEDLASQVHMSASTFHQYFRSVTGLSPIQYQKQLRLHEARRLMLSEQMDAASAAFEVGYESPSQFSREYSRLFKAPPMRDIQGLRQQVPVANS